MMRIRIIAPNSLTEGISEGIFYLFAARDATPADAHPDSKSVSQIPSAMSTVVVVKLPDYRSWSRAAKLTSPEGRSKNASLREAFFGWGEWCNALNGDGSARFPPPEIAKRDFDLPAGEVGPLPNCFPDNAHRGPNINHADAAAI